MFLQCQSERFARKSASDYAQDIRHNWLTGRLAESSTLPSGLIAGYVEPWNISLRPQESYTVGTSISSYYVIDGAEKLESCILRPCQLWVEIDQPSGECMVPSKLKPVPCWHGKVASNTFTIAELIAVRLS